MKPLNGHTKPSKSCLQVGITTEILYVQINVEINTVIMQKQFFKNDPEIPVITK
jgi:hypothetical protein